jgi:chromosome segregation ATPase
VYSLENENYSLKNDLNAQIERANQIQAQHDATALELNNAREHSHALAETIISRDSRVSELERLKDEAVSEANHWHDDLTVSQNRVSDLEALVSDLRSQLEHTTRDKDGWVRSAHEYQRQAEEYKVNFDRIQSILNPPRPVESYVSEASPVADVA